MVIEKPFYKSADFKLSKIILICNSNLVFYNFFFTYFCKASEEKGSFLFRCFFQRR